MKSPELDREPPLPPAFQRLVDTITPAPDARIRTGPLAYADEEAAFDGYLALDGAITTPRPAVLLLHTWNGIGPAMKMRAHMLARLGYTALAADLFGAGVRPGTPAEAASEAGKYYRDLDLLRHRVRTAFDVLAARDDVDASRVVVAGYCFGGTAALEFARGGAAIAGAVSFHGTLIVHEPPEVAAIAAPLLIVTGGSDDLVPDSAIRRFADELRSAPTVDWRVSIHSGAPHAFTVPGTDRYRERADFRSWDEFTRFLHEVAG